VHVQRISAQDQRLWVEFAGIASEVDDSMAARVLTPLLARVAELGLARSQVGDATLELCARMPELTKLDLRGTKVTAGGLRKLQGHGKLAELVLGETRLSAEAVASIASLPSLRRLSVWKCGLDEGTVKTLRERCANVVIDAGDHSETQVLEEEPPLALSNDAPPPPGAKPKSSAVAAVPINQVCPVSGKPVDPAHTVVDQGKTIGFCCEKCAAKFSANPEQFRAAIR